jgi:shikimate dehydrogenase
LSIDNDRYAVIGNPVEHSKSPEIHERFAAQTGQSLSYERVLAPRDGFARTLDRLVQSGFKGANVTLPFKLEAFAMARSLSERARAAGAVNTLSFRDGMVVGDNTDGVGLVTDIVRNAKVEISGRRVLLVGAGGAARGVLLPLLAQHPAQVTIANRTGARAEALAGAFSEHGPVRPSGFHELRGRYDVVINATSASLDSELPALNGSIFGPETLAYDMMYAAEATVFMRFAASHGARVRDGLGMLVEQAAESFFVWRGVRPDTALVHAALRAALNRK